MNRSSVPLVLALGFAAGALMPRWARAEPEAEDAGWIEPDAGDSEGSSPVPDRALEPGETRATAEASTSGAEGSSDTGRTDISSRGSAPASPAPTGEAGQVVVIHQSSAGSDGGSNARDDEPAPPPTLIGRSGRTPMGAYGAFDLRVTRIAGREALLVGGEAALLIDHRFALGGAGYGLASGIPGPQTSRGNPTYLGFGYGGLVLRSHFVGESPVYLSAGLLLGAGGVGFVEQVEDYELELVEDELSASAFFVAEPELGVHANVTRWLRLGVNVTYRATWGIGAEGYTDGDFSGFAAGANLAMGWF